MLVTRRTVLGGVAAAGAMAALPGRALPLADGEVITVSDGNLTLPADFIFGPMPEAELAPIRAEYGLTGDTLTPPCNVTLLRRGERLVLFDCGSGPAFQPTAGTLLDTLDGLGVTPEDVTDVVFTHGHPDHLWGVLDDFDEPVFYNARHLMGRIERDYWMDPDTVDEIGQARAAFAVGAARRLEMMAEAIEVFEDGAEVLPGVAARMTPGHTPGHMSFLIAGGAEPVLVIGDAVGNDHVAFARPGWASGSDQDAALGATTRAALLDQAAAEKMAVIGFHLGHGGLGRVERAGDGFRFAGIDA